MKRGLASAVITEDSDILVYLAAVKSTAPVLYKMDQFGKCQELGFDAHKLSSLPGMTRACFRHSTDCGRPIREYTCTQSPFVEPRNFNPASPPW